MKKWFISACGAVAATALTLSCLCTSSCEKYIIPRLECDNDTIRATAVGGIYEVTISSNVRWMFDDSSIGNWINIDVKDGSSDYADAEYPLKVTVKANDTGAARECAMTYASATLSRLLVVEQEAGEGSGGGDATGEE